MLPVPAASRRPLVPAHAGARHLPTNSWVTLKRTGRRPLRFFGTHLVEAGGWSLEGELWHEINLYEVPEGGFVVNLRVHHKAAGSMDRHLVWAATDIDQVVEILRSYNPHQDVPVPSLRALADHDIPSQVIAALELHERLRRAAQQYLALLERVIPAGHSRNL